MHQLANTIILKESKEEINNKNNYLTESAIFHSY
jgi:hypothetical protein